MNEFELSHWQELMLKLAGLYIGAEKSYLFTSRLKPLLLATHKTMDQVYQETVADPHGALARQVIDLMTTHETSFFRDNWPFQMFRDLLRHRIHLHKPEMSSQIQVLSAGCSTGEEPYSLAMILQEELSHGASFKYQIKAIDIAEPTLARARIGWYADLEKTVDPTRLDRYFTREGKGWQVKPELQSHIVFEERNLLEVDPTWGVYDFIFCRNVAIYFQREDRAALFEKLTARLMPHGYLIIGASESLSGYPFVTRQESACGGYFYTPKLP